MQPQQQYPTPPSAQPPQVPYAPTPLQAPAPAQASKYSAFYLVILILTCIYAALSVLGMFISLIKHIGMISDFPALGILSILGDLASLLVVPAVILLFLEKKWGLWLIFAETGINLLLGIAIVIVASLNVSAFIASSGETSTTTENASGFILGGLIFGLVISIFLSVGWCILCYFAWKSQQNHRKLQGLAVS